MPFRNSTHNILKGTSTLQFYIAITEIRDPLQNTLHAASFSYVSSLNLLRLRNTAIITSTIKIASIARNVASSLTAPFGRIKKKMR